MMPFKTVSTSSRRSFAEKRCHNLFNNCNRSFMANDIMPIAIIRKVVFVWYQDCRRQFSLWLKAGFPPIANVSEPLR